MSGTLVVSTRLWWALIACVLLAAAGLVICGVTLYFLAETVQENVRLIDELESHRQAAEGGVTGPAAGRTR